MSSMIKRFFLLTLGALFYAFALRAFILPNGLFDNGTTGISVLIFYGFKINLSLVFVVLNIPFWIIGYRMINKPYGLYTVYSVLALSLLTYLLEILGPDLPLVLSHDLFIASVFGGILLGLGVGLIIRNGGSLDGVETTAIILSKKFGFTIGEIAFAFNIVIMLVAGLIFGLDKFFYSLISYFISTKIIDITVEGFSSSKNVLVISEKSADIAQYLIHEMKIGVTYLSARGGYTLKEKNVIMLICNRFDLLNIKKQILLIDSSAFVVVNDVHEVTNGRIKKV